MKKVLIISTSLRENSNSEALANEFAKGVKVNNNEVEIISLKNKNIAFCRGCLVCGSLGHCVINDDAIEIADKMVESDVIVFATPIYYYEMSGAMKTLLDRCNSMFYKDYKFRDIYFIATAAEDELETYKKALSGLEGWVECYPKCQIKDVIFQGGVTSPGDIINKESLIKAYNIGKAIN
ncbi:MAG: flavodoxin family protein [Bacilli bacterium]